MTLCKLNATLALQEVTMPPFFMRKEGVSKCAPSFFMHKAPTFTSRGFVIT